MIPLPGDALRERRMIKVVPFHLLLREIVPSENSPRPCARVMRLAFEKRPARLLHAPWAVNFVLLFVLSKALPHIFEPNPAD
jgi:hypothetical protein